jgi:hypothetical protein
LEVEVDPVDRDQLAESLDEAAGLDQGVAVPVGHDR